MIRLRWYFLAFALGYVFGKLSVRVVWDEYERMKNDRTNGQLDT
jgi:hypothetical protein